MNVILGGHGIYFLVMDSNHGHELYYNGHRIFFHEFFDLLVISLCTELLLILCIVTAVSVARTGGGISRHIV